MKNLKYIIATLFVVAVGAGIFWACEKENNNEKNISNKIQKAQCKLSPGEKAQIAGADLTGFLTGGGIGTGVGTAIPAIGSAAGFLIGGTIGGVGASISKWGQIRHSHDTLSQGIKPETIINMYSEAGNDENPYDSVGLVHYQLMNYFFENEHLYGSNLAFDNLTYYDNAIALFPQFYLSLNITNPSLCFSYSDLNQALGESEGLELYQILNQCIENEELKNILLDYDEERRNIPNFSSFYDRSIQVENEVLNNPFINSLDKQIALSYMATARYGYWYWILIYDNEEFEEPIVPVVIE